jgi:hypothetical protein
MMAKMSQTARRIITRVNILRCYARSPPSVSPWGATKIHECGRLTGIENRRRPGRRGESTGGFRAYKEIRHLSANPGELPNETPTKHKAQITVVKRVGAG